MYYRKSTQVPNKLFDIYLKTLSVKELKVLLVVVRQTLGWVDSHGERKRRDWMSQKFFVNKTGLSPKSVSLGIDLLVSKRLIRATNRAGVDLWYARERRGQERVYFELSDSLITFSPKPSEKNTQDPRIKSNNTKLTYTKQRSSKLKNDEQFSSRLRSLEDVLRGRNDDDCI
jgi:hypothetical protein